MQDTAIIVAGAIGAFTALIHSYLVRRKMSATLGPVLADNSAYPVAIQRLVPLLLDFSCYIWFLGGVLLMSAPFWLSGEGLVVAALAVGSSYAFAFIGNFWGTHGRHPGWVLYALASGLLLYGAWRPIS